MSGTALTTVSPSRTSSRRSTPCVEGCCGPNETVISVSESGSGFRSNEIEDAGMTISFACILSVTLNREILAQRMALIIRRSQYPDQIRVAVESDAEHVINLSLQPVRRFPQSPHRRQARVVLFEEDLYSQPVIAHDGIKMICDCEARACEFAQVHAADVAQIIEPHGRLVAQPGHKFQHTFALGDYGVLVCGFDDLLDRVCEF